MHLLGIVALLASLLATAPAPEAAEPGKGLPPANEVLRHAIEHARLDLAEVSSWKRQARRAALLPRLQLEYANRLRDTVNVDVNDNVYVGASGVVVGPEEGSYKDNAVNDHYVSVRAIWEFGEALFHPVQVAISAEARNVLRERTALTAEVHKHYFIVESTPGEVALLQELVRQSEKPEKLRREIFLRGVACEESSATLDGLTGGWWRSRLPETTSVCQPPVAARKRGER